MQPLDLPDADVRYFPHFLAIEEADRMLDAVREEVPWQQDELTMFGKTHPLPRLTCWMGDPGAAYTYSGISMEPQPWTPTVADLRDHAEALSRSPLNSVLLNLYRTGSDRMGWHADDEPELGPCPTIVSISLGAPRDFLLRHRRTKQRHAVLLTHGSALVMAGQTQHHWVHSLPVRRRVDTPRINLTFRHILEMGSGS